MPSVLIVDDDDAVRDAFSRVLRHAGFTVTAASNGIAGLSEVGRQEFDAVICDFKMPDLGGQGFFEQVEEHFPIIASRVVFLTAYAEDPRVREFLQETGQPVLGKPIEPQDLVAEVQQMVARAARRRSSPGYGV